MTVAAPAPWHAVVQTALACQPGTAVEATAVLWGRLLTELRPILGDGALKPLYSRSLRITSRSHAWLLYDKLQSGDGDLMVQLTLLLQEQPASVAKDASSALFVNFFELLASLIGDALTARILRAAWGQWISEIIAKDRSQ